MNKMYSVFFVFLFNASLQLNAQQVIDSLAGPESVIKVGKRLFVSNLKGGFISEIALDGKFIRREFQKTLLKSPKGLAVIENTIYVTDITRIVGFNIKSGEQVFEFSVPEATFLNDLCVIDNNRLGVTDSKTNKIHLINILKKKSIYVGSVFGANGITYNKKTKQLYVCGVGPDWNGMGKLYSNDLNKTDPVFTEIQNSPTGFFDGIEFIDTEQLLVDDGKNNGRLIVYNLKTQTYISYTIHNGAADLFYDKTSKKVYIPDVSANRILILKIKDLKKDN